MDVSKNSDKRRYERIIDLAQHCIMLVISRRTLDKEHLYGALPHTVHMFYLPLRTYLQSIMNVSDFDVCQEECHIEQVSQPSGDPQPKKF